MNLIVNDPVWNYIEKQNKNNTLISKAGLILTMFD